MDNSSLSCRALCILCSPGYHKQCLKAVRTSSWHILDTVKDQPFPWLQDPRLPLSPDNLTSPSCCSGPYDFSPQLLALAVYPGDTQPVLDRAVMQSRIQDWELKEEQMAVLLLFL
jgi:hypothetical protein